MRKQINPIVRNTLRLVAHEMQLQLEENNPDMDIIREQLRIKDSMETIIDIAENSPKGQIEIVFVNAKSSDQNNIVKVLKNSTMKISFFNTENRDSAILRTVIVSKLMFSKKENIKVYTSMYNASDNDLQIKE